MRIVHTADWHIGKTLNDYSLLDDQRVWFERFLARLDELRPDALIVAGDLYDRSVPSAEAVSFCNDILQKLVLQMKIPTFVIAGNHDSGDRLSFASELLESSGLYMVGKVTKEIRRVEISDKKVTAEIYLLPYFEPHNVKMLYPDHEISSWQKAAELLTRDMVQALDPSKVNLLVAHGLFSCKKTVGKTDWEASVGGSELIDISSWQAFDYVALGHLHSHRTAGRDNMVYAGSPLKYSTDEAGQEKSITVLSIDGKKNISISTESIPPLRDVKILTGEFADFSEKEQGSDDYVFLNLTDTKAVLNAVARLKGKYPNLLGVRYPNMNMVGMDRLAQTKEALAGRQEWELFANFYQNVKKEKLTPEQEDYVKKMFDEEKGEAL